MDDIDRIAALETVVWRLLDALRRRGTEQDGNWGHPSFEAEIGELQSMLPWVAEARGRAMIGARGR